MSSPPGPDRPSTFPSLMPDERRSLRAPRTSPSIAADSTREVAQEDFLFHLYRGSELLQENRVLEAKEELEFALTVQPLDPKGQDLLGAVYFRLGLFPRAIQIYQGLSVRFLNDVSIKINLALCYLKTGQSDSARRTLQEAVQLNPDHKRAWGYLGLALQQLGELEQAQVAFERGGHETMAKRLTDRRERASVPAPSGAAPHPLNDGVRLMAETAFSELESGELRFALATPETAEPSEGPWHTVAFGEVVEPRSVYATTLPPPSLREHAPVHQVMSLRPSLGMPMPSAREGSVRAMPPLLLAPPGCAVALHTTGVLLVRVASGQAFAARLEALRVIDATMATRVLHRRANDADKTDVLGGIGSPLVRVDGEAKLVLGPRPSRELAVLALDDELAVVREDLLLGFELRLSYENGRVGSDGESSGRQPSTEGLAVVQLRGSGMLALELGGKLTGFPCTAGRRVLVRREGLVGWVGRLSVSAVPSAESPNGQRGLIGFSGDGTVLVHAR